jgi:hypothetical protein
MINKIKILFVTVLLGLCSGVGAQVTIDYSFQGANIYQPAYFNAMMAFLYRSNPHPEIYIDQTNSSNYVAIDQIGGINQQVIYKGIGNNNTIMLTQQSDYISVNMIDLYVAGNNNQIVISQVGNGNQSGYIQSTKVSVNDNNNNVTVMQTGTLGNWAGVTLQGGNKSVMVAQVGYNPQFTNITMTGYANSLNLTQVGGSHNFGIISNCATPSGCGGITVTQN